MKSKSKSKLFNKITPLNLAIVASLFLGFIITGFILVRNTRREKATISANQIKIQKGEKIVIVDESGLVEYRTSEGVFYETWDASRIKAFFSSMREKAKKYLEDPVPDGGADGYWLTIFIDGEEVRVFIPEDEELDEVFEKFESVSGDDQSLSDLFDDYFGGSPTERESQGSTQGPALPTPTPTTKIVSAQGGGTPTAGGSGGSGGGKTIVECGLYEEKVTQRTVISNTICITEAATPTP